MGTVEEADHCTYLGYHYCTVELDYRPFSVGHSMNVRDQLTDPEQCICGDLRKMAESLGT